MQVHYDEGLAIHIGSEPCVSSREAGGEASAGERIGQPLSRESASNGAPTPSDQRKATRLHALPRACDRTPTAGAALRERLIFR